MTYKWENSANPSFDLFAFLSENFPGIELGGGLFYRWPLGIRFKIGLKAVPERPVALFEAAFAREEICILIEQEWPAVGASNLGVSQKYPLFSLPGAFDFSPEFSCDQADVQCQESEEVGIDRFTLRWTRFHSRSFGYGDVFQAIGNTDHARTPSLSSRVYFVNPRTGVMLHMYDDRGLDVICWRRQPLVELYAQFHDWVLEYDREQIMSALGLGSGQ